MMKRTANSPQAVQELAGVPDYLLIPNGGAMRNVNLSRPQEKFERFDQPTAEKATREILGGGGATMSPFSRLDSESGGQMVLPR